MILASPAGPLARQAARILRGGGAGVSRDYSRLGEAAPSDELLTAWKTEEIAHRQRELVDRQLRELRAGEVAPVFATAAELVRGTGIEDPALVEIGCSSGYYSEALALLLGHPIRYTGVDYSEAMIKTARAHYPEQTFLVGEATDVPLPADAFDIALSAAVLMHVLDFHKAIAETARVSRGWCAFHRTPVTQGESVRMRKTAYGVPVFEWIFNEAQLLEAFADARLDVQRETVIGRLAHKEIGIEGEDKSYLCRKLRAT
jgi:SAM-dependent methyltransferase